MKSFYYRFVNYIQEMPTIWYTIIWMALFATCLVLIMKFFKKYNGTQKKFEKISLLVLTILLFVVLVYLTYIRK